MDIHWPSVRKVFSGEQQVRLKQTPEKEQSIQFTRMWTECEAALKLLGTGFAAGAVYENEGRFVHWFQYEDYMVACAANEDFQISVREAGREELVHGLEAFTRGALPRLSLRVDSRKARHIKRFIVLHLNRLLRKIIWGKTSGFQNVFPQFPEVLLEE